VRFLLFLSFLFFINTHCKNPILYVADYCGSIDKIYKLNQRDLQLMTNDVILELKEDNLRKTFIKYIIKVYQMIPTIKTPRILDIGCGSGVPTIVLAELSGGYVIGLDINQSLLDKLNKKIKEKGLTEQVHTINRSMSNMDFPPESFDIIWSEGSIFVSGFKNGLKEWKRFLKPKGFLVIHDEIKNLEKKFKLIPKNGYKLLDHFTLTGNVWWTEYYAPLEKRIEELRKKYNENLEILHILNGKQKEVDGIKENPKNYSSVYFIMQKM